MGGWEGGPREGRRPSRACARPLPAGHAHAGHAALGRPARVTRWRRRLRPGARAESFGARGHVDVGRAGRAPADPEFLFPFSAVASRAPGGE